MNTAHKQPTKRGDAGFTLVEVVVASVISVIGLIGLHGLMMWIFYATAISAQRTEATLHAQAKMEDLLSLSFTNVVAGSDEVGRYARAWEVGAGASGCKELTVAVEWDDGRAHSQRIEIKSVAADSRLAAGTFSFGDPLSGFQ